MISHRLYRESCCIVHGNYIKDLSRLGRDLCRTILIDNSSLAFCYNLDSGIPIKSWFSDKNDTELKTVMDLLDLIQANDCKDVRETLKDKFDLYSKIFDAVK